jgi:hypothetical protein
VSAPPKVDFGKPAPAAPAAPAVPAPAPAPEKKSDAGSAAADLVAKGY